MFSLYLLQWDCNYNYLKMKNRYTNLVEKLENRDKKGRFKKGYNPHNTGKKWSEEVKRKISKSHIGKIISEKTREKLRRVALRGDKNPAKRPEIRKKISLSKIGKKRLTKTREKISKSRMGKYTGKNNPNWKGNAVKKRERIRKSKKYIEWRTKIFKRDKFTCQNCGIIGKNLNAHHIIPFSLLIETPLENLIFDANNGVTLCVDCHKEEHPKLNFKIKKL